jgi:hypothetical protein
MDLRPSTSLIVTLAVTLVLVVTAVGLGLGRGGAILAAGTASAATGGEPRVTVACPSVGARLTRVPEAAQDTVDRELAALDGQVTDADARLSREPGAAAGVADELAEGRGAAIGRIVAAVTGNGGRVPDDLQELAECALVGAELDGAGRVAAAPGTGGWSTPLPEAGGNGRHVSCPSVVDALPAVPVEVQGEVASTLDELRRQIQEADARIDGLTGDEGGAEFIGNAVLGPLESRRVAAIDRIAIAIGRTAERPAGLEGLAPCTFLG